MVWSRAFPLLERSRKAIIVICPGFFVSGYKRKPLPDTVEKGVRSEKHPMEWEKPGILSSLPG